MDIKKELIQSVETGLINKDIYSDKDLRPQLLINDYQKSIKLFNNIIDNLKECNSFIFSVAFITKSGLLVLKNALLELEKKGIKGKILTTDYLFFNEPDALRGLLEFKNIEARIYTKDAFHIKGYIFNKTDYSTMIIGSSNITQEALLKNKEWNMMISSLDNGELFNDLYTDFNKDWNAAQVLSIDFIEEYERNYHRVKRYSINMNNDTYDEIKPTQMQKQALENLRDLRKAGEKKGLIVSATGTGKTYLSAFDIQQFEPRRVLFVVHRANIAKQAKDSFENVLKNKTMGMLYGKEKDLDKEIIFSTIQTISKEEIFSYYSPNDFDYIIIDEVHRSGANSYLKILNYFKPKFLLGMTATPERTDGYDIFSLFDNNIAFEIRLHEALKEELLAPFHYFGIADILFDNYMIDEEADFKTLTSQERVNKIIETLNLYGYSGKKPKGLIFCSRIEESKKLSDIFNERGFKTISIDASTSEISREKYMDLLESDSDNEYLDFIFSVDVFNEGIDIQSINMIIMLRPTQSAIIFVQQLGRGLRKYPNKDYLVVLDFIGNYDNNYMIPIALYGDRSYNKDNLRKFIQEGNASIPGCTTIHFDEISKEKIYKAIDQTSFRRLALLKSEYKKLKIKLNKTPMMMDFYQYGYILPFRYIDYSTSYYDFITKYDDFELSISEEDLNVLRYISKELIYTKRLFDILLLKEIIEKSLIRLDIFKKEIFNKYRTNIDESDISSAINTFNGEFLQEKTLEKYNLNQKLIIREGNIIKRTDFFNNKLNSDTLLNFIRDAITFGHSYFIDEFYSPEQERNGFYLYKKYSRKDVARILKWSKDFSATMFGYLYRNNDLPIFVTYDKDEEISASTKYEDYFISRNKFNWMSKNNRNFKSKEIVAIRNQNNTNLNIPLFVKKSDDEGTEFYYMGNLYFDDNKNTMKETYIINDKNKKLPIVNIVFNLKEPVKKDIYKYITVD